MFRDFKKGGYDLEKTQLKGHRLISLILLITLAYSQSTISGAIIRKKRLAKYVGKIREKNRKERRHSDFYLGLKGKDGVDSLKLFRAESRALMKLNPLYVA